MKIIQTLKKILAKEYWQDPATLEKSKLRQEAAKIVEPIDPVFKLKLQERLVNKFQSNQEQNLWGLAAWKIWTSIGVLSVFLLLILVSPFRDKIFWQQSFISGAA